MKNLHIYTLISFFALVFSSFLPAYAGGNGGLKQSRCTAVSCATPTKLRPAKCTLISVHFRQPKAGPVLYEVWIGDHKVIEHTFIKPASGAYRTCRSLIAKATKVVLCSKTAGGRVIATNTPLADFRKSAKKPLVFANVPKKE